jgi:hypothetical protein
MLLNAPPAGSVTDWARIAGPICTGFEMSSSTIVCGTGADGEVLLPRSHDSASPARRIARVVLGSIKPAVRYTAPGGF